MVAKLLLFGKATHCKTSLVIRYTNVNIVQNFPSGSPETPRILEGPTLYHVQPNLRP